MCNLIVCYSHVCCKRVIYENVGVVRFPARRPKTG